MLVLVETCLNTHDRLVAYDSNSFTLVSIALAGGDLLNAVLPTLAAASAQVFAVTEGGTIFHLRDFNCGPGP